MSTKQTGAGNPAPKPQTAEEIMKALHAPFRPEDIEWRVGATTQDKTKGIALAYVTNRAIMNRLDEVVGPFNWKNEYREWKANSQLCGLSIRFEGEWITKWDGADDSDTEAVKGGLSDAMKRSGYQWGIGRYLYNLENEWHPIKQQGKSYVLTDEPHLPAWALPEGFQYPKKQTGGGNAGNAGNGRRTDAGNRGSNRSTGNKPEDKKPADKPEDKPEDKKPADKPEEPQTITKQALQNLWTKCSGGIMNGFGDWYTKKAGEQWTHADMKKALEKKLADKEKADKDKQTA